MHFNRLQVIHWMARSMNSYLSMKRPPQTGDRRRWLKLTEKNTAETGYYAIQRLIQAMARKYGRHMRRIRTDNGGEFTNTMINQLLVENNVERELTAADSAQENGMAEQTGWQSKASRSFISRRCV